MDEAGMVARKLWCYSLFESRTTTLGARGEHVEEKIREVRERTQAFSSSAASFHVGGTLGLKMSNRRKVRKREELAAALMPWKHEKRQWMNQDRVTLEAESTIC